MNRRTAAGTGVLGFLAIVAIAWSASLWYPSDDVDPGPLRLSFGEPVEDNIDNEYYQVLNRSEVEPEIPVLVELFDRAKAEKTVVVPKESEDAILEYLAGDTGREWNWRPVVFEGFYYRFSRHIQ